MDPGKAMASGVTVIGPGAPSTYHVAPRVENSDLGMMSSVASDKKKRGRPRKYKPDEPSNKLSAPPKPHADNLNLTAARPINSDKKHKTKIGTEKLGILFLTQYDKVSFTVQLRLVNCF